MRHAEIITDFHYSGLNPVQFGHEKCAPSQSFGPAVRTYWLLHYIVSGFGTFTRDNITYTLTPGTIFVIPPYLETYYEADATRPWTYIWIGFTTQDALPDVFSQPFISCPEAGAQFDEMLTCSKLNYGKSAFLSGCLWKLIALLLEQHACKTDYVEKALSFMHSEYMHQITIQEITERLCLNRSYFYTIFTNQMGISPSEYLITLRLTKAAELIAHHGENPTVAAASVGYDDYYNFSKIFKKYYGLSPRAYKHSTQNK